MNLAAGVPKPGSASKDPRTSALTVSRRAGSVAVMSNVAVSPGAMARGGGAAARLAAITPPGHEAVIHLTLTDDHPWAQAFVVIEARPIAAPQVDGAPQT